MHVDESLLNTLFGRLPPLPGAPAGRFTGWDGVCLRVQSNATKESYAALLAACKTDGFCSLQEREVNGMRYAALQKGELRVNLLFSPHENELRVTAAEKEQTPRLRPSACEGGAGTTFYAFENDQTLIDCGMCLMVQCPDYSFF